MLPKAISLGMSDTDELLKVCSYYPNYRNFTDWQLRTLIPMNQLMLQIQECSSTFLVTVVPVLWIGKLYSVLCVRAGVDFLADSIFLRVTGSLSSLAILRQLQRQEPLMSRNG